MLTKEEIKRAKEHGVNYDALKRRIGLGWDREIAITKELRIYDRNTIGEGEGRWSERKAAET